MRKYYSSGFFLDAHTSQTVSKHVWLHWWLFIWRDGTILKKRGIDKRGGWFKKGDNTPFQTLVTKEHTKEKSASSRSHMYNLFNITRFKKLITDGPFYICVQCNCCLYKWSVIQFHEDQFEHSIWDMYTGVVSFDEDKYIFKMCARKIRTKHVPCQAVIKKL